MWRSSPGSAGASTRAPRRLVQTTIFRLVTASLLILGGCGDETSPPEGSGGPIDDVLEFAPSTSQEISVTDWSAIRGALAGEEGGATPPADPAALLMSLTESGVEPFVTYESEQYPDHKSLWGWDVFDLAWEGYFSTEESGGVHLLKFDDGFDLSNVVDRFEERGYEMEEVDGISVYAHPGDLGTLEAEWFMSEFGPRAPLEVLNAGVFEEANVLAFSTATAGIEEAITVFSGESSSAAEDESFASLVDDVAGSAMSFFAPGEVLCDLGLGGNPTPALTAELEKYRGDAYEAGAAAYFLAGTDPTGVFVFHYGSEEAAEADLELRSDAASGVSLATAEPYANKTFQLEDASVEGQDLLLELGPSKSGQLALASAILNGDLLFAAC